MARMRATRAERVRRRRRETRTRTKTRTDVSTFRLVIKVRLIKQNE
jgi:hypothetical protein